MGKPLCQKSTPAGWVPITSETVFYSFKSARPRSIPASPVLINIASPLKSYSTHKRDIRGFHAFQKEEPIRLLSNFCWPVWTQPVSFVFRVWWLFPKPGYPGFGNRSLKLSPTIVWITIPSWCQLLSTFLYTLAEPHLEHFRFCMWISFTVLILIRLAMARQTLFYIRFSGKCLILLISDEPRITLVIRLAAQLAR